LPGTGGGGGGSEKLKQNRHSLIRSMLTDLNNFIKKQVTAKPNDFISLLFKGQNSRPYNKIMRYSTISEYIYILKKFIPNVGLTVENVSIYVFTVCGRN